jgi:hypothetical protein
MEEVVWCMYSMEALTASRASKAVPPPPHHVVHFIAPRPACQCASRWCGGMQVPGHYQAYSGGSRSQVEAEETPIPREKRPYTYRHNASNTALRP